MSLALEPPVGLRVLPPEQMDRDSRAQAAWLALRAGWPVDPDTWAFDPTGRTVIVDIEGYGHTWGMVRIGADEMLVEIERHFGKAARERAERAIG